MVSIQLKNTKDSTIPFDVWEYILNWESKNNSINDIVLRSHALEVQANEYQPMPTQQETHSIDDSDKLECSEDTCESTEGEEDDRVLDVPGLLLPSEEPISQSYQEIEFIKVECT